MAGIPGISTVAGPTGCKVTVDLQKVPGADPVVVQSFPNPIEVSADLEKGFGDAVCDIIGLKPEDIHPPPEVGSSGVREEQHRFAQHFRDVHTITQHALCSAGRFESMGQVILGRETDWFLF